MPNDPLDGFSPRPTIVTLKPGSRGGESHGQPAYLIGTFGDVAGKRVLLPQQAVIGRESGSALQLTAHDVSRQHARIRRGSRGQYIIEDLQSVNGTLVNGQPIVEQVLQFGDTIQIGTQTGFIFTHHNPAEEQLIASERVQSAAEMANEMAHHLNNTMAVLMSSLSHLRDLPPKTTLDDAIVEGCLSDLEAAVWRTSSIVRQVNSFAQARRRGSEHLVDLSRLLSDLAKQVDRLARGVVLPAIEPGVMVEGNAGQLEQVLSNLAHDALDAAGEGGELHVSVRYHPQAPAVDSRGQSLASRLGGSPCAEIELRGRRVGGLDRHRALATAQTRAAGLALPAIFDMVKRHGGHLQMASKPSHDAVFWVYLPAVKSD